MRFRFRHRPKHVQDMFAEIRDMNDEELDKYAEKARDELMDWLTLRVKDAIDADIALDETCATLVGIILEKSYEVFVAMPAVDLNDEEKAKHFRDFCHMQGHKIIEVMHHIVQVYTQEYPMLDKNGKVW